MSSTEVKPEDAVIERIEGFKRDLSENFKLTDDDDVEAGMAVLQQLRDEKISVDVLRATKIGVAVNKLRKHPHEQVRIIAKQVVTSWKALVPKTGGDKKRKDTNADDEKESETAKKKAKIEHKDADKSISDDTPYKERRHSVSSLRSYSKGWCLCTVVFPRLVNLFVDNNCAKQFKFLCCFLCR